MTVVIDPVGGMRVNQPAFTRSRPEMQRLDSKIAEVVGGSLVRVHTSWEPHVELDTTLKLGATRAGWSNHHHASSAVLPNPAPWVAAIYA
jgi:hypothetical protein